MDLPHEPVGWFLFLVWAAVIALVVFILLFCAFQTLRLWFSSREERRQERKISRLRNVVGLMYDPKEIPDKGKPKVQSTH